MNEHFLLTTPLAERLYFETARDLPIIDYHNHLPASDVLNDRHYENITALWITPDPYKHRAMRILGVPEQYITGNAPDEEKFAKWYDCLPRLIGNPLYDWSVMEFDRLFGIELARFDRSAEEVWNEANEKLADLSARSILAKFNIEYSAPCTGLTDDLSAFENLTGFAPSLRGDTIAAPDCAFVRKLESLTGKSIANLTDFDAAVRSRLDGFQSVGCRFSDHALDDGFRYVPDDGENDARFARILAGEKLCADDASALSSRILKNLGVEYARRGLTMQLHIGAKRATSVRLRAVAGAAGGYAAIGNSVHVQSLVGMLNDIEQTAGMLPKTILFTLNPADNAVMSVLSGSFSRDGMEAVVTQGPAWWWCDHAQGMRDMLDHFSVFSVLSTFIGMTTDSRSLLSFARHDYFRRILCQWMGEKAAQGTMPDDFGMLSGIVKKICYENAKICVAGD